MTSDTASTSDRRALEYVAFAFATLVVAWFVYLLVLSGAAWLHPEALAGSVYVWSNPGQSFLQMLRKIFDWRAFDPNVNRVRPLNDIAEVIDAIARPYVTILFGVQPSLNVTTVGTALLAPAFFFAWFRRVMKDRAPALMLMLLFISSIGFLSLTIAYVHPAKRVNLVLLCAALYFAQRAEDRVGPRDFAWMYCCLFASFFSDELALANFLIVGLIYWPAIAHTRKQMIAFALLPVLFLAMTKWGLPAIYRIWSVHGPWDALADHKKFAVFGYLLTGEFHLAAAIQLGRSILSTFGISTHTAASETLAILCLVGGTVFAVFRSTPKRFSGVTANKVLLAALALVAANWFATLLDWYPFPHEVSYLGSFNYYYHSSIVVPVLVWLAFFLKRLLPTPTTLYDLALLTAAAIVAAANFSMFNSVNTLVKVIHYYPYSHAALFAPVVEISQLPRGSSAQVAIRADSEGEYRTFEAALRHIFGKRWDQNGFYRTHKMLAATPIMSDAHIGHLFRSYRPWVVTDVRIERYPR